MANERPPQNEGSITEAPATASVSASPESIQPVHTPPHTEAETKRIQELLPQQGEGAEVAASTEHQEVLGHGATATETPAADTGTAGTGAKKSEHHAGGHGHHAFTATVGATGWFAIIFGLIGSTLANLVGKVFKATGLKAEGGGGGSSGGGGGGGGHDHH